MLGKKITVTVAQPEVQLAGEGRKVLLYKGASPSETTVPQSLGGQKRGAGPEPALPPFAEAWHRLHHRGMAGRRRVHYERGNYNVVLCERGIRTFETATRNTLDISAVPVIKERSCLPIIVDPSHAAGKSAYIQSLSLAPPPAAPTASSSRFTLALSALCPTPSSS